MSLFPHEIFDACATRQLTVGSLTLEILAVSDIDGLLDHYAAAHEHVEQEIPYFAVLWDSALGLANHLVERYGDLCGKRVVELGCGLGLCSIVAAKLGAKVLATDFHPDCEAFLLRNAARNGVELDFMALDWRDVPQQIKPFDMVLASDVLYHAPSLSSLVGAACGLCHKPDGRILISDPGRDRLQEGISSFEKQGFVSELVPQGDIFVFDLVRAAP